MNTLIRPYAHGTEQIVATPLTARWQGGWGVTTHMRKIKGLWAYFVLTYALMVLTWGLMAVFQFPGAASTGHGSAPAPGALVLFLLGGFTPSIAGIITTWYVAGRRGLRDLVKRAIQFNLDWHWYAIILVVPILILLVRLVVQFARGGAFMESHLPTQPHNLIGFTISIIVFGPLSEEFGWRGFALDRLLSRWNVLRASLVLGVLWAFWHLPLFFIPGTTQQLWGSPLIAFPIFAVLIIAQTVVISWIYINTGRSLFAAMLFHFTANWLGSFAPTLIDGGMIDRLVYMVAFVLLAVGIVWWWRAQSQTVQRQVGKAIAGV